MTTLKKISVLLLVLTLNSCGEPVTDKLQNKWWLETTDGDLIIQFLKDGKVRDLNDDTLLDYIADGETITFNDEKYKINRLDDQYLEISTDDTDLKFRLATSEDLLVGDWEGVIEDNEFSIDFQKDGDFRSKANGERNKGKYNITNDTLKLGSDEFSFKISEDLNNLTLTLLKDKQIKLELYRDL